MIVIGCVPRLGKKICSRHAGYMVTKKIAPGDLGANAAVIASAGGGTWIKLPEMKSFGMPDCLYPSRHVYECDGRWAAFFVATMTGGDNIEGVIVGAMFPNQMLLRAAVNALADRFGSFAAPHTPIKHRVCDAANLSEGFAAHEFFSPKTSGSFTISSYCLRCGTLFFCPHW
jgi:hypothetical protein